jgi:hypothetical protein
MTNAYGWSRKLKLKIEKDAHGEKSGEQKIFHPIPVFSELTGL